jgi:predicted esterase
MNSEQKPNQRNQFILGILIVVGISLLFAVRIAWSWAHFPHKLQPLAKVFSSIEAFQKPLVVNHLGTLIGMVHNTSKGIGIFIASVPAQKEQMICEANGAEDVGEPHVFGWSSDDSTFAYRWNVNLHFVNADGTMCPGEIPAPYLKSFTWLSSDSCAYIDSNTKSGDNTQNTQLGVAQKVHGIWQETATWPLHATNEEPRALLAVETNNLAWLMDNAIWQMDVLSGKITSVYSNPQSEITSVAYSKETGTFLFVETTKRSHTSSLFTFSNGLKLQEPIGKFVISDAQWIDKGKAYALLIPDGDNASLLVRDVARQTERAFFSAGQVADIFCNGEDSHVYALASHTNEAPGIWLCDASNGDARRLLSPWGFADFTAHFQPALIGYAPLPNKHSEKFVLIPPVNFSRQKKYPLVIGLQGYDWMNVAHATYSQALANSGVYVALTGYHYMRQTTEALLDYTNNVLAIYNQLKINPNVDTSRVYLFAFSSSTIVVNQLVAAYPGRWRGIMLFNPTANLPLPKKGRFPPLLATAGSDEEWLWKQFPEYQEKLARAGFPLEWYVHPDEGHIERSQNTMYQRTLLMGKMIFGD